MATADEDLSSRVADPEEYNQTERLRAINEVRKQAGEVIQWTMTQLRMNSEFDQADRQQILRAAIYRYLTNIEWLAEKAEADELLSETQFGIVELQPPDRIRKVVEQGLEGDTRVIGKPNLTAQTHPVRGIHGYLNAPPVYEHTWTVTVDSRHEGASQISESTATYMPAHISLNAFRMANRFLSKNGIDVELETEQHRAVVDRDVLEEIEEWRKQNIQ